MNVDSTITRVCVPLSAISICIGSFQKIDDSKDSISFLVTSLIFFSIICIFYLIVSKVVQNISREEQKNVLPKDSIAHNEVRYDCKVAIQSLNAKAHESRIESYLYQLHSNLEKNRKKKFIVFETNKRKKRLFLFLKIDLKRIQKSYLADNEAFSNFPTLSQDVSL